MQILVFFTLIWKTILLHRSASCYLHSNALYLLFRTPDESIAGDSYVLAHSLEKLQVEAVEHVCDFHVDSALVMLF